MKRILPSRKQFTTAFRALVGLVALSAIEGMAAESTTTKPEAWSPPPAASKYSRTDINPALIYHSAFLVQSGLPSADREYLMTNEWRGRSLDSQCVDILKRYDSAFGLLRQAARQKVPCDWGYDLDQGPALLLPHLAQAKAAAQIARLRFRWHLESGRPEVARDEWHAALAMGRAASRGGMLIGTLVQIAIENILAAGLAENWYRIDAKSLGPWVDGIDTIAPRGSVADCIEVERVGFRDWIRHRVEEARDTAGSEEAAMRRVHDLIRGMLTWDTEVADEAKVRATGSSTGEILAKLRELDPLYDEMKSLSLLPYPAFAEKSPAFQARIEAHTNTFVSVFFPSLPKCRTRELVAETRLAMVRAARRHRLDGEAAAREVRDPLSGGPFEFRRFVFEGVDRGLEVRSRVQAREFPEVLIFVEKDGPAFHLDGPNAGKAIR